MDARITSDPLTWRAALTTKPAQIGSGAGMATKATITVIGEAMLELSRGEGDGWNLRYGGDVINMVFPTGSRTDIHKFALRGSQVGSTGRQ